MPFFLKLKNSIFNIPSFLFEMIETFITGQKMLGSELKWLGVKLIRNIEIKQLEKLRQKEYIRLGKLTYNGLAEKNFSARDDTIALSKSQLDFLTQEIKQMEQALINYRQRLIEKRKNNISTHKNN